MEQQLFEDSETYTVACDLGKKARIWNTTKPAVSLPISPIPPGLSSMHWKWAMEPKKTALEVLWWWLEDVKMLMSKLKESVEI